MIRDITKATAETIDELTDTELATDAEDVVSPVTDVVDEVVVEVVNVGRSVVNMLNPFAW